MHMKAKRLEMGLSQADVARFLGITRSNYNAIENGRRSIGPKMAKLLIQFYTSEKTQKSS